MVGVPFFFMMALRTVERIGWPLPCLRRSQRISAGPNSS